jgi:O-antigen/teichoic acid export membrane protein
MLRALLKESVAYGTVKVLAPILGFLTVPFFTRIFEPSQYGLIALLSTVVSVFTVLFTLSLETAFTRYFHEKKYSKNELFNILIKFHFTYGAMLTLTFLVIGFILLKYFDFGVSYNIICVLLFCSFSGSLITLFIANSRMNHNVKSYSIISFVSILSNAFFTVYFVYVYNDITFYFIGILLSNVVTSFFCFYLSDLCFRDVLNTPLRRVVNLLKFSLPLLPATIATFLNTAFDRWSIAYFLSSEDVALYSVGAKLGSLATIGVSILMFVFMPYSMKIIQLNRDEANILLDRALRYFSIILFSGLIILQLLSPLFVKYIAPVEYSQSVVVVGILAMSAILFGLTYFSTLGSWKAEKSKDYSMCITLGIIINITLNFVMTPIYGIIGAAIATFLGMLFTVVLSFYISYKRYAYRYSYLRLFVVILFNASWCFLFIYNFNNKLDVKILFITLFLLSFNLFFNLNFNDYRSIIMKILKFIKCT